MAVASLIPQLTQRTPDWIWGGLYGILVCVISFYAFSRRKKPAWTPVVVFLSGLGLLLFSFFGGQHPKFVLLVRGAQLTGFASTKKAGIILDAQIFNSGSPSIALNWRLDIDMDGIQVKTYPSIIPADLPVFKKPFGDKQTLSEIASAREIGPTLLSGYLM